MLRFMEIQRQTKVTGFCDIKSDAYDWVYCYWYHLSSQLVCVYRHTINRIHSGHVFFSCVSVVFFSVGVTEFGSLDQCVTHHSPYKCFSVICSVRFCLYLTTQ